MMTEHDNPITHEPKQTVQRIDFQAWLKGGELSKNIDAIIVNGTLTEIDLCGHNEGQFDCIAYDLAMHVEADGIVCEWDNFKTIIIR